MKPAGFVADAKLTFRVDIFFINTHSPDLRSDAENVNVKSSDVGFIANVL